MCLVAFALLCFALCFVYEFVRLFSRNSIAFTWTEHEHNYKQAGTKQQNRWGWGWGEYTQLYNMVVVAVYVATWVDVPYPAAARDTVATLKLAGVRGLFATPFVDVDTRDGVRCMPLLAVLSVEIVEQPIFNLIGEQAFTIQAALVAKVLCVDVRRFDLALLQVTAVTETVLTAEAGPVAGLLSHSLTHHPQIHPGMVCEYAWSPTDQTWDTACQAAESEEAPWEWAASKGLPSARLAANSSVVVAQVVRTNQMEGKPLWCTLAMDKPGLGLITVVEPETDPEPGADSF